MVAMLTQRAMAADEEAEPSWTADAATNIYVQYVHKSKPPAPLATASVFSLKTMEAMAATTCCLKHLNSF